MSDDGWIVPVSKKSKNQQNKQKKVFVNPSDLLKSIDEENNVFEALTDDEKTSRTKGHFDNLVSKACDLAKSSFFAETLASFKLSHPELAEHTPLTHTTDDIDPAHQKWKSRIISSFAVPPVPSSPLIQFASCLGIGPFLRSPAAQHQLALFLLICLYTHLDLSYCEVYDPILTSTERYILTHHFGFRVPDANTEGATSAEQSIQKYSIENPICPSSEYLPMFFYLPHCGVGLASNVLKANWSQVHKLILMGNSAARTMDLLYFAPVKTEQLLSNTLRIDPSMDTGSRIASDSVTSDSAGYMHISVAQGDEGRETVGGAVENGKPQHLSELSTNNVYLSSLLHTQQTTPHAWVAMGRVLPWTKEFPLPTYHIQGAFNDTAIHSFAEIPSSVLHVSPPLFQVPVQTQNGVVLTSNPEIIPTSMRPC